MQAKLEAKLKELASANATATLALPERREMMAKESLVLAQHLKLLENSSPNQVAA